ncbi:ABC transporter permease [Brevibacillus sp. TJ4]|uniref:ABC transporter permease n=1 Tax=Brevibacillus sp. TJ4 TaxID=3234853 RepID=UPI0037CD0747
MVYWLMVCKSYLRNIQYRLSHLVNNVASSIFGLVFIAIWTGVLQGKQAPGPYDAALMAHYIMFVQCVLWVTTFLSPGLNVQVAVRSGAVSLDLMRPVHYMWFVMSQESGRLLYNACYRSLPIGLILGLAVGFFVPAQWETYVLFPLSLLLGMYCGLLLFYLVGITAFWTTEIRWLHLILVSLIFGLGGQMIPVDLLPGALGTIAPYLPFACLIYYPVMTALELMPFSALFVQVGWALVLTALALLLTRLARKKLEIQGG